MHIPSFDNAAMDGYAVRRGDLPGKGPWNLPVVGTAQAGPASDTTTRLRGAIKILTGAKVPHGYNAVIRREECIDSESGIQIGVPRPRCGLNIRFAGEHAEQGEVLLASGALLEAHHIGLLASIGIDHVSVRRKINIGIASVGDELIARTSGGVELGMIFDCNRPMLHAAASGPHTSIHDLGIYRDHERSIAQLFDAGAELDVLITTAGASVGEFDLVKSAFVARGGRIDAWQVAMKPGKPVLFGQYGNTRFLGLPGNPLAAFVGYQLFGVPVIQKLTGGNFRSRNPSTAIAGFEGSRHMSRTEYLPVEVDAFNGDGLPVLRTVGCRGSGSLVPLIKADGLAVIPPGNNALSPGDRVKWMSFSTR